MKVPRCYSCRKAIAFQKNQDGRPVPINPGLVKGVFHSKSGFSEPLLHGEKVFELIQMNGRGVVVRPVREGETTGVLEGYAAHRSTCAKQGVPRS